MLIENSMFVSKVLLGSFQRLCSTCSVFVLSLIALLCKLWLAKLCARVNMEKLQESC